MGGRSRKRRRIVNKSSILQDQDVEEEATTPAKPKSSKMSTTDTTVENDNLAFKIFLNPLIMGVITQYLPLRCLPTLRSTCKLWNKLMVPEYRSKQANSNKEYLVEIDKDSLDSVYDTLNETAANPFSSYKFEDIQLTSRKVQELLGKVGKDINHLELNLEDLNIRMGTFRSLIFKQCPVLSTLALTDRVYSDIVPSFWKFKLQGTNEEKEVETLPNLKRLNLELEYKGQIPDYDTSDFELLKDLLAAAINLETIKIDPWGNSGLVLNGVILDILSQLKQADASAGNLHKIQCIKFGKGLGLKNLEDLVALSSKSSTPPTNRLGLKKLDLRQFANNACFNNGQAGVRLLNQFLRLHAGSLKKVTASLSPWDEENDDHHKYKLVLPVMTSLKHLKLQIEYFKPQQPPAPQPQLPLANNVNADVGPNADNNNMLPNLSFVDSLVANFPNLQKLRLLQMDWMKEVDEYDEHEEEKLAVRQANKTAFMNQLGVVGSSVHPGITEFNVVLEDDSSYLVDFASLLPNVNSLKITFTTQLFQEVWNVWPRLERLNIGLWFIPEATEVDSGITGIPVRSLGSLKRAAYKKAREAREAAAVAAQGESEGQGQSLALGPSKRKKKEMKELDWKELKTQAGITDLAELRRFHLEYIFAGFEVRSPSFITDLSGHYGFIPAANSSCLRTIYIRDCSKFTPKVMAAVEAACGPHGDFVPFDEGVRRQREKTARNRRLCNII